MELGLHGLNTHGVIAPDDVLRLARLSEELGYRSWWTSDHVVQPAGSVDPMLDSLVHLAFVAAATTTLELATGVLILPQRDPRVLAKQAASLDVLSGGRLRLGVGVGWEETELRALGVSPRRRGRLTDEHLDAMEALWAAEPTPYTGSTVSFAGVDALPKPVRPHGPHLVVGGHSPAAFRRALTRAHGWYGVGVSTDLEQHLAGLRAAAAEVDRPERLGRLEISFMHWGDEPITPDLARRYADLGVDRLVLYPLPLANATDVATFLEQHADLAR
ncbi:TIGR03619 family F420-dependent LLM class oxidoreductase [Actinosynnema sp. NPDC020468]|uniref:TIGR03619 family F420-dependent LLM class oxidoreductase n=1 Tax=Actinosynnema sp. NPDC020468 TaxID=3154488 RepID=UPI0033EB9DB2